MKFNKCLLFPIKYNAIQKHVTIVYKLTIGLHLQYISSDMDSIFIERSTNWSTSPLTHNKTQSERPNDIA